MDPRGEERPVLSDQASCERDREQEDRRGRVREEICCLAKDLLRVPRPILGRSGHHQNQGTVAEDEGAGEDGDVLVRRKGVTAFRLHKILFERHFLPPLN